MGYTRDYRDIQGYTRVYKGLQGYRRVCKGIQGYTRLYRGMQGYTRVYRGLQGYAGVYKGIQGYTMVYRGIQGYTKVYKGIQGVSKGIQGFIGYSQDIKDISSCLTWVTFRGKNNKIGIGKTLLSCKILLLIHYKQFRRHLFAEWRIPLRKLTEREGRTGEYWSGVVAVRTERSEFRTKTTEGQYSPVRFEQAMLVSSLLYGTRSKLVYL